MNLKNKIMILIIKKNYIFLKCYSVITVLLFKGRRTAVVSNTAHSYEVPHGSTAIKHILLFSVMVIKFLLILPESNNQIKSHKNTCH